MFRCRSSALPVLPVCTWAIPSLIRRHPSISCPARDVLPRQATLKPAAGQRAGIDTDSCRRVLERQPMVAALASLSQSFAANVFFCSFEQNLNAAGRKKKKCVHNQIAFVTTQSEQRAEARAKIQREILNAFWICSSFIH